MPRSTRHPPEPPIFTVRVRILGGYFVPTTARSVWREIEIAANQTLADLGEAIPLAFGFDDPHLWSFFLSGRAWDHDSEYALHSHPDPFALPPAPPSRHESHPHPPYPPHTRLIP